MFHRVFKCVCVGGGMGDVIFFLSSLHLFTGGYSGGNWSKSITVKVIQASNDDELA